MGVNFLLLEKLFSGLVDKLGDILRGAVFDALRGFFYFIASAIYSLMIKLYKLFMAMSRGRLLDNEVLEVITSRVGLLLGLIMLFYVVISFIRMLVEPDTLVDSKKGAPGVIKKVLIVIVLLGFSSFAFDTLYSIQTIIINEGVISKIVWPSDDTLNVDQFGNIMAAELFTTFYKVDSRLEDNDEAIVDLCRNKLNRLKTDIYDSGDFSSGKDCLSEELELDTITVTTSTGEVVQKQYEGSSLYVMELDWLLLIGFGIAYVYFFISYSISVGVRMIQLTILEIISPMAFISYLAPKEGMFMNWLKVYFSTYVDVFIRVAIINLSMFLIAQIITTMGSNGSGEFWSTVNVSEESRSLVMITIFIALLVFAKRVPDLIKQLFPNMSGLGFGGFHIKDALGLGKGLAIAGAGVGIAAGGAINSVAGAVDRGIMARKLGKSSAGVAGAALSGIGAGWINSFRHGVKNKGQFWKSIPAGFKAQHESDIEYEKTIASGGSATGKLGSKISSYFGETTGQSYKRNLKNLEQLEGFKKRMYAAADEVNAVRSAKDAWEHMTQRDGESTQAYAERREAAGRRYRALRNAVAEAGFGGKTEFTAEWVDENGKTVTEAKRTLEKDDLMYAQSIKSIAEEADRFRTMHSVVYYDMSGGVHDVAPITTREALHEVSSRLYVSQQYVSSNEEISRAIANDTAAGISDQRVFGPPGGDK